jgi:hypothetical protein
MGGLPLDLDEIAVFRALLHLADSDRVTIEELCAVASATAGQRVERDVAGALVAELLRRGCATRATVQRTGAPRAHAYALTPAGRRRVQRLLDVPARRRDQGVDVLGGLDEWSA